MNAHSIGNLAAIATTALGAHCGVAIAQGVATVAYYKIIISDDPGQTGWAGEFFRFSPPAINENADVAFEGDTTAPTGGRGVWFGDFNGAAYTVSKVAQEGDVFAHSFPGFSGPVLVEYTLDVPEAPSTLQGAVGFSLPVIDNAGRIAFIASIASPDATQGESVLLRTDASQTPIAIAGAPLRKALTSTDGADRFHHRWFNASLLPGNPDHRFDSHIAMPLEGDGAIAWYANLETIDPADQSDLPPFMPDADAVEREGGMFFGASFDDYAEIVRYQDVIPGTVDDTYGVLPAAGSQNFLSAPAFNKHGHAAFTALFDSNKGVLTAFDTITGRRVVAIDGQEFPGAPDTEALMPIFRPSINQAGATAFLALTRDGLGNTAEGIWAEDASLTLQKVLL